MYTMIVMGVCVLGGLGEVMVEKSLPNVFFSFFIALSSSLVHYKSRPETNKT